MRFIKWMLGQWAKLRYPLYVISERDEEFPGVDIDAIHHKRGAVKR